MALYSECSQDEVAGLGLTNDILTSLELSGDELEVIECFKYLGSLHCR